MNILLIITQFLTYAFGLLGFYLFVRAFKRGYQKYDEDKKLEGMNMVERLTYTIQQIDKAGFRLQRRLESFKYWRMTKLAEDYERRIKFNQALRNDLQDKLDEEISKKMITEALFRGWGSVSSTIKKKNGEYSHTFDFTNKPTN